MLKISLIPFLTILIFIVAATLTGCGGIGGGKDTSQFAGKYASCLTADGTKIVFSRSNAIDVVEMENGTLTSGMPPQVSEILCAADNEVVTVRDVRDVDGQTRLISWQNSAKTYRLVNRPSYKGLIGAFGQKYLVTASQDSEQRTITVGAGNDSNSYTYNQNTKLAVFTLDDADTGQRKDYAFDNAQLGFPADLKAYSLHNNYLNVSLDGILLFAVWRLNPRETAFYRLNMLSGKLAPLTNRTNIPDDFLPDIMVADAAGKIVLVSYRGTDGRGNTIEIVRVLEIDTGREIFSRKIEGVALDNISPPQFMFDSNSRNLTVLIRGQKVGTLQPMAQLQVFDLKTGSQISDIDVRDTLKLAGAGSPNFPVYVRLIGSNGNEAVLRYSYYKASGEEFHISKIAFATGRPVWDTVLK